jgi:hypothetical protein
MVNKSKVGQGHIVGLTTLAHSHYEQKGKLSTVGKNAHSQ